MDFASTTKTQQASTGGSEPAVRRRPWLLAALLLTAYGVYQCHIYHHTQGRVADTFPIVIPVPLAIQKNWGAYRPWFSVANYRPVPKHCTVNQVNIVRISLTLVVTYPALNDFPQLQRHGARYPTKGAQADMLTVLNQLKSAKTYLNPLLFLKSYEFDLGTDDLVYFGAQQYAPPSLFPLITALTHTQSPVHRQRNLFALPPPRKRAQPPLRPSRRKQTRH